MKKRVVLVDADTPIYTAAAAAETCRSFYQEGWQYHDDDGKPIPTPTGGPKVYEFDEQRGIGILNGTIRRIQQVTRSDEVIMCLSNYQEPWRKKIMPWYKANRHTLRRPVGISRIREYVKENYRCFEKPGLEGDDICGILFTMPDAPFSGEKILASADKDMKTLPGLHYHLRHHEEFEINQEQADRWHMIQTLIGDTIDNYKGCPGIGESRADRLLATGNNIKEWWPLVVGAFKKAGYDYNYALLHAQVSRICQHTDWDFDKKEVILWKPPEVM